LLHKRRKEKSLPHGEH